MTDCAYLALAMVPGIGRARLEVLLATFGSAEAVLDASPEDLAAVEGVTPALVTAVTRSMLREAEDVLHRVAALGAATLLPADPAFPQALREIPDAPTYLFALGNSSLLHDHAVGIVGSRTHSRYGAGVTRMFAGGLARAGLVIVSGMARGLDAIAHGAALDAGGGTVGVLGNGFGVIYPVSNRTLYERVVAEGCLLTEHPPGARPHRGSFPRRTRAHYESPLRRLQSPHPVWGQTRPRPARRARRVRNGHRQCAGGDAPQQPVRGGTSSPRRARSWDRSCR